MECAQDRNVINSNIGLIIIISKLFTIMTTYDQIQI